MHATVAVDDPFSKLTPKFDYNRRLLVVNLGLMEAEMEDRAQRSTWMIYNLKRLNSVIPVIPVTQFLGWQIDTCGLVRVQKINDSVPSVDDEGIWSWVGIYRTFSLLSLSRFIPRLHRL